MQSDSSRRDSCVEIRGGRTMNPELSPDLDSRAIRRFKREALFSTARAAMFNLETTLPFDSEVRQALYRARISFNDAWNAADPDEKSTSFVQN